jgi:hypothetical protein
MVSGVKGSGGVSPFAPRKAVDRGAIDDFLIATF